MKKFISVFLSLVILLSSVVTVAADEPSDWAKEEVEAAISADLIPEYLQKDYKAPVTRGAVAEMFMLLLEKASGKTADQIMEENGSVIDEDAFTDTDDRNVFNANALGIINGTGQRNFSPDGTLKRAQIAAIINRVARVMGYETEGYEHGFTDITDNYAWAYDELGWPVAYGIIKGVGGNRFSPGADLTTEQAILITYRAYKVLARVDTFDERFLSYISEHTEGNYMVSPLSFRYALGLLLAGADGETKTELLSALGVGSDEEWTEYCLRFNSFIDEFYAGLARDIENHKTNIELGYIPEDSPEPFRALRVANSVWKAEWVYDDFKTDFKKNASENYSSEYLSFTPDDVVGKVNAWADEKTEHMIERLLPDDYPTDDLAVILMNALYFKDAWSVDFREEYTKEGDFLAYDGQTTRKDFMNTTARCGYYEDENTQLVILPMDGGVYMAFVLGSTDGISEKLTGASHELVNVSIPKMDLETDLSDKQLVDFLKEYGVKLAFDDKEANFTAMMDFETYVSDIIQKTRIKLDEEGVEAAAVTAVMMDQKSAIEPAVPKEFRADRPFTFYVFASYEETDMILFAGEIVE